MVNGVHEKISFFGYFFLFLFFEEAYFHLSFKMIILDNYYGLIQESDNNYQEMN